MRLPELHVDAIHIWLASLDVTEDEVRRFETALSADEGARAGRFHFEKDRRRFVAARGMLRAFSGAYLGLPPRDVVFSYGPNGKPTVAANLEFNVSHSGESALFAFARNASVGIDLESVKPDFPCSDIARGFFTKDEIDGLSRLTGRAQRERFFKIWTAKEAYLKATGEGLSAAPDRFEVFFENEYPTGIRWRDSGEQAGVFLQSLSVGGGFVATLAATRRPTAIERYEWAEWRFNL